MKHLSDGCLGSAAMWCTCCARRENPDLPLHVNVGTGSEKSRLSWEWEENEWPGTGFCCVGVHVCTRLPLVLPGNWSGQCGKHVCQRE